MTQFTSMKTQQGNEMVQRLVEAGSRLYLEQKSEYKEAEQFITRSLKTLSCAVGFEEADSDEVQQEALALLYTLS